MATQARIRCYVTQAQLTPEQQLAARVAEARDEIQARINHLHFPIKNREDGARMHELLETRELLDQILLDQVTFQLVPPAGGRQ